MKCGIIGYGRFGKMWAEILHKHNIKVAVFDSKPIKQRKGIIAAKNLKEVVAVDFLFLLVPISKMKAVCKIVSPILSQNTVVVDACSVKVYPVKVMKDNLSPRQPIIATHPLFGPDSVKRLGLVGRKIVMCPVRANKKQISVFKKILKEFGLHILNITPEEHDQSMARTQAIVHFIGRGLAVLKLKPEKISTPDYESLLKMNTMVENDTWQLFCDMQNFNPYAAGVRKKLLKKMAELDFEINK